MATRKPQSTNSQNRKVLNGFCGMEYALDLLSGRWKLLIMHKLENKVLRFSELKKVLPNITDRMLTRQLQELERHQLISRAVHAGVPVRVEYALTEIGQALAPTWKGMEAWGTAHQQFVAQLGDPLLA
jgi:DNA-binding HxlR family transcriptional regulator